MEALHMKEGRAFVRINEKGWRDRAYPEEKPQGIYRIAVLGDSFVEAVQVESDQTVCSILQSELDVHSKPGRRIEVMNFGVSGYGTAQELQALRHYVSRYSPDLVLLCITTVNDILDNSFAISGEPLRPYFHLQGPDLILDSAFLQSDRYRKRESWLGRAGVAVLDRSRVLQLINQGRVEAGAIYPPEDAPYLEPATKEWKDAWAVSEALILRMNAEVSELKALFRIVLLTSCDQVDPDENRMRQFMKQNNLTRLDYPHVRLKRLAEANHLELLDLLPAFSEHARRTGTYLHGFGRDLGKGHWNEKGHELAGKTIARWLVDQGALK